MQQTYHFNATTNINVRSLIQNNPSTNLELASRFNVSPQTISKWKNRDFVDDVSSRPHNIKYALSDMERALAISLRSSTWLPIDEVWECLLGTNPKISRSSIYRCLVNEKINKVPQEKKDRAKKFKAYKPGYLHIDVTYLPKFKGRSYYLFVAIDRATRTIFYHIHENKKAESAEDFMEKCLDFFPVHITHILTDNGLEFTNRLIKSKKGKLCEKPSKVDVKCTKYNIEHRLTKPATPKTNGMVERANGTIKNNTILKTKYKNEQEMKKDIMEFLCYYNLYRRHGSLRKELKVKTPLQAVEKWYGIEPGLFKKTPQEFKNKLISLQTEFNQLPSTTS
ncbi:MAG TPA: IS481 family transposase [Gillisia sp.]|nr:IS481 family transposase [Gillisia sp.]